MPVVAPAVDCVIGSHPATMQVPRSRRQERTGGRLDPARNVLAPAGDRAVDAQPAGVEHRGADRAELPGGRIDLPMHV